MYVSKASSMTPNQFRSNRISQDQLVSTQANKSEPKGTQGNPSEAKWSQVNPIEAKWTQGKLGYFGYIQLNTEKSCIRETPNLSTDAESSTNIFVLLALTKELIAFFVAPLSFCFCHRRKGAFKQTNFLTPLLLWINANNY